MVGRQQYSEPKVVVVATSAVKKKTLTAANAGAAFAFTSSSSSSSSSFTSPVKMRANSSYFSVFRSILFIYFLLLLSFYGTCEEQLSATIITTTIPAAAAAEYSAATTTDRLNLNATVFDHGDVENITVANVTAICEQRCRNEDGAFLDEFGIKCPPGDGDEKCFLARCSKGCQLWWRALQEFEPCQEACSSLQFFPFDLPCITACEMAQRHYWHLQRLVVGAAAVGVRPLLLNDSSLTLQWPIEFEDKYLSSRPFNVQYRIVRYSGLEEEEQQAHDGDSSAAAADELEDNWYYLTDYNCDENFTCDILDGLMPYTSYRFRFELPFGEKAADVLHSPPTRDFRTSAEGAPISSPIILNVQVLDESHVSLYWKPGDFTNGPLEGYYLSLGDAGPNGTWQESRTHLIPRTQQQYVIADLNPRTNYTLKLCMINSEGCGPEAKVNITTKELPSASTEDANLSKVLLVGEYSIQMKSLEPLTDTLLVYRSDKPISGYSLQLATQRIFVVDAAGGLFSTYVDEPNEREALYLNKSLEDFKPAKIAVDWLHLKLYLAGETADKTWTLARTDLDGNEFETLSEALPQPIRQLEVEPINGWLFWLQEDSLQRLDPATKVHETVIMNANLTSFSFDFVRNFLIVYDSSEEQLFEVSIEGSFQRQLRQTANSNNSKALPGAWQSFALSIKLLHIYATNGTHLMHYNSGNNEVDIWVIREVEWWWGIKPLTPLQAYQWQPQPQPPDSPIRVQALLTANMAKISWQPPALLPFQTMYAWRNWDYELELMDVVSNSAFNIRPIKGHYFDVEQLQANNLYNLRVRATERGGGVSGSEWSEPMLTRTWPRGEYQLLWATATGFYETNEIGEHPRLLFKTEPGTAEVRGFVQLNGTIFYVAHKTLRCANIMNPELNCSFHAAAIGSVGSVGYDWRGAKVYWTDEQRNAVLRANVDGSEPELLPIFDALEIEIDSYAGHIYYSTGVRLSRRPLNGGAESDSEKEVQYFHVNGFGGSIRGFALDLQKELLYWVVRQRENHVRLFRASIVQTAVIELQDELLEGDIWPGSLEYLREIDNMMWLQVDYENRRQTRHLVFTRAGNLSHRALLTVPPTLPAVCGVHLKVPYLPYLDTAVIPDAVDIQSIRIDDESYWDDFTVKWSPVAAADNYSVHYKVLLQFSDENTQLSRFYTLSTSEPLLRINEFQSPLLQLSVSITPHSAWHVGSTVTAQLRTPAAAPTQPKRLRVFIRTTPIALQSTPNVSALIRWDPPENLTANTAVAYKIYCWLGAELMAERVHNTSRGDQPLETSVAELLVGQTYAFQVQAFAAGRRSGGDRTALHAVYINPEVQAVPMLLYATREFIAELDMDLNRRRILVQTASEVEHLTIMQGEQRLLWINENVELLTFVPNSAPVKLARMRAEVLALTADWITRRVYWAELDNEAVSIYQLDLCRYEGRVMVGVKLYTTESGRMVRQLVVLPYSQTLLWLEHSVGEHSAALVGRNLTDDSTIDMIPRFHDRHVVQLKNAIFQRMFEGTLSSEVETVNLLDLQGNVCAYEVQRQLCTPLKLHFDVADDVEAVERDNGYIYTLKNGSVRAFSRRKQHLEYHLQVEGVRRIRAFNYQEYPPRECMLPIAEFRNRESQQIEVMAVEESHFTLQLPRVAQTDENCWLPLPGVRYLLTVLDNEQGVKLNATFHEQLVNVTQLKAFTNYTTQLKIATFYQQKLGLPLLHIPDLVVRTAVGTPSMPRNFTAHAVSPTEIGVQWVEPEELNSGRIWYELHWQARNITQGEHRVLENGDTLVALTNMLPATEYTLWLLVFSTPENINASRMIAVQTFEKPTDLILLKVGAYNLTLSWAPPADVSRTFLTCRALNPILNTTHSDSTYFSIDISNKTTSIIISDLRPRTRYEFLLELSYAGVGQQYRWPEQTVGQRFIYETLGDRPSSPGRPKVEHIMDEIFKVSWQPARGNGAAVIEYHLEALQSRNPTPKRIRRHDVVVAGSSRELYGNKTIDWLGQLPWAEEPQPLEDKWLVYCRTSSLSCIVNELYTMRLIMFRVRARNDPYGWGAYSEHSNRVSEPFVSPEKRNSLVIAILAPAVIVSTCVLVLILIRAIQNRRLRAKKLLEKSRPGIWRNSILQQQQLMASRNRAFSVASHSTMYTGGPLSDADIALLPHISWNQITLLNFLGSGAFGEVYEGLVRHEDEEEPEKVAIKSLRKGASEFAELLQEAQLMSNFKHENIVRLIGVCCDAESISIIMEHMEGGDLLSTLRESRPNSTCPTPALHLLDLITMCIDVATGCSYLENMHFVHRDLACRNCLVSSRERSKRVVKIGDFGLARDIYKNDYYRKEGEGLLPVRWMSPESLVDGIFSTQSDVWAFAVLCWEILTLGQQPYAARNNLDVLQFVKEGGRLEQPENCPDNLFALMLQCWKAEAAERPSFRKCLNVLLAVKADVRCVSVSYTKDDGLCAMYANNQSIVLSTFMANPSLPQLEERCGEPDDRIATGSETRMKGRTLAEKKAVLDGSGCDKEDESESLNDDASQLIALRVGSTRGVEQEQLNYYTNEGVSRL